MLKSTFKKISAIAIAGAMLAGMMAVPAGAMSYGVDLQKQEVITENFDATDFETTDATWAAMKPLYDGSEYLTYNTVWDSHGEQTRKSAVKEGTDKYLQYTVGQERTGYLYAAPESAIDLSNNQDDGVIEISFDYKAESDPVAAIDVGINGTYGENCAYSGPKVYVEGDTSSPYDWTWSYNSTTGVLMRIRKGAEIKTDEDGDGVPETGTGKYTQLATIDTGGYNGYSLQPDTWYNFRLVVRLTDATKDNEQTVELQIRDASGTQLQMYKKKLDANVTTGDADGTRTDTTYDKYQEFKNVHFAPSYLSTSAWTFGLDNINVKVSHDVDLGLTTDLKDTLMNDNFADAVSTTTSSYTPVEITGTNWNLCTGWSGTAVMAPADGGGLSLDFPDGGRARLSASLGNVAVEADDEIHVSYDLTLNNNGWSGVRLNSSATEWGTSDVTFTKTTDETTAYAGEPDNLVNRKISLGEGSFEEDRFLTFGQTYHIEKIIKVSDPMYGGKQTVTLNITDGEIKSDDGTTFEDYTRTFFLDADKTDDVTYTKYTSLDTVDIVSQYNGDQVINNVKVELVKPGFEVKDIENSGNAYTFSGDDAFTLNYAANTPYTGTNNFKVIVAQYDETGKMLTVSTMVEALHEGTVAITPNASAKTIKAMILDITNAVPSVDVFTMTRAAATE